VEEVRARVRTAGHAAEPLEGGFLVRDPWGTAMSLVSTAATGISSRAVVRTDKPTPYLLQLAKHFRHKLEVTFDERHAVIPLAAGHAEVEAGRDALIITAYAQTAGGLARVEEVVGSHLERFGRRDELRVAFTATRAETRS
jgi:hypothetical protein